MSNLSLAEQALYARMQSDPGVKRVLPPHGSGGRWGVWFRPGGTKSPTGFRGFDFYHASERWPA